MNRWMAAIQQQRLHTWSYNIYILICCWTACQTCSSFSIFLPQSSWDKKSALWTLYTFRNRFRDNFRPPNSCRSASLVQTSWGFSKADFTGCLVSSVPLSWHFQGGITHLPPLYWDARGPLKVQTSSPTSSQESPGRAQSWSHALNVHNHL